MDHRLPVGPSRLIKTMPLAMVSTVVIVKKIEMMRNCSKTCSSREALLRWICNRKNNAHKRI